MICRERGSTRMEMDEKLMDASDYCQGPSRKNIKMK